MVAPPPKLNSTPIIVSLYRFYHSFHTVLQHFPKSERYSLGATCQSEALNVIHSCLQAANTNAKRPTEKFAHLQAASAHLDTLRLLICLSKDCRCLPNQAYQQLDSNLVEIGRMLGGWLKSVS
ncbi:MAG: four helix bundle protein [Candidatus Nomurabacteria bacterium]|nr:four helix bundle protein [Candidatus Nomurabacteria bacterium]